AAEDQPGLVVGIDQVVADNDAAGDIARVFGADLDPLVVLIADVLLDDDVLAAIDVNAAGKAAAVVGADVVDRVVAAQAVARHRQIPSTARQAKRGRLAADHVDADVVVVVDAVVRDLKVGDVAVDRQGFGLTVARVAVVNLIAFEDDVAVRVPKRRAV